MLIECDHSTVPSKWVKHEAELKEKIDESLAGSIKRQTHGKGRKEEERARTQVRARSAKAQSGSQRGKETNYFSEPPPHQ